MKSKQSTFQSSSSSKRPQSANKPVKKQAVSSFDYGAKSAAIDSALAKAETTQLESYIKSRSQFLDVEIDKLRNKLHAPLTKGRIDVAGASNANRKETEDTYDSGNHRSRIRDDSKSKTCLSNQLYHNTAGFSAIGQGMSLNSRGNTPEQEQRYPKEASSRSPKSPEYHDRNRRINDDRRLKNNDEDRRIRIGERGNRNTGRRREGDSSDDSDLSDGYSRMRTNERITGEERRTDNRDKRTTSVERNEREGRVGRGGSGGREEGEGRGERGERGGNPKVTPGDRRDDVDDSTDAPGTAVTALENLFDRISRGKSDNIVISNVIVIVVIVVVVVIMIIKLLLVCCYDDDDVHHHHCCYYRCYCHVYE